MKTYFITGGAGFIGSSLAKRLLKEQNKVVILDNFNDYYNPLLKEENVQEIKDLESCFIYKGDIRNRECIQKILEEHQVDVIVHLAAMAGVRPSIENPILYQDVNGIGTQNILEEAKLHGINNFILISGLLKYF